MDTKKYWTLIQNWSKQNSENTSVYSGLSRRLVDQIKRNTEYSAVVSFGSTQNAMYSPFLPRSPLLFECLLGVVSPMTPWSFAAPDLQMNCDLMYYVRLTPPTPPPPHSSTRESGVRSRKGCKQSITISTRSQCGFPQITWSRIIYFRLRVHSYLDETDNSFKQFEGRRIQ